MLSIVGKNKVRVSRQGVAAFNATWHCSELRSSRAYWFEFDSERNLIDTDVPEQDDGSAALAMSKDCEAFLFDDVTPSWAE